MQPDNLKYSKIWSGDNMVAPIPFNSWFTMDMYMLSGEGTNGRMRIKITPDGGSPITLFDINNTTIYPSHPELNVKSWQPFKLYTSDIIMDFMSAAGKNMVIHYNDFKWFQS